MEIAYDCTGAMHICMTGAVADFDWTHARAFLAAAEDGSFSAAARRLKMTQPTVGRHVAALEQALGVALFERDGRGLTLTTPGLELLEHVRAMRQAADRVVLSANGQSQTADGHVTISGTDMVSAMHLPQALERLRQTAPGITVEIIAANHVSDLLRREADIAVRHVRPEQPDLIARLVRETAGRFWPSTDFLDRHGRPATVAELAAMDFVGFGDIDRMAAYMQAIGVPVGRQNFRVSSANGIDAWELVRRGFGIGAMVEETAILAPEVECVLPGLPPIPVPIWLTTHRELRTSRRIRVVFDVLAEALSDPAMETRAQGSDGEHAP